MLEPWYWFDSFIWWRIIMEKIQYEDWSVVYKLDSWNFISEEELNNLKTYPEFDIIRQLQRYTDEDIKQILDFIKNK